MKYRTQQSITVATSLLSCLVHLQLYCINSFVRWFYAIEHNNRLQLLSCNMHLTSQVALLWWSILTITCNNQLILTIHSYAKYQTTQFVSNSKLCTDDSIISLEITLMGKTHSQRDALIHWYVDWFVMQKSLAAAFIDYCVVSHQISCSCFSSRCSCSYGVILGQMTTMADSVE